MTLVMRNGGLVKFDEEGYKVAYGYIEVYLGDNRVLRLEDDEYSRFEYWEYYKPEEHYKRIIEDAKKRRDDPFLFAGEFESEKLKDLIKTYEQIKELEKRLKELYCEVDSEIRELLKKRKEKECDGRG